MTTTYDPKAYYSQGFQNLIECLRPVSAEAQTRCFPPAGSIPRISKTDTVHAWLFRYVDSVLQHDEWKCCIEPDIAVVAEVSYADNFIEQACVQVVVVEDQMVSEFRKRPLAQHCYLRLDYDKTCLGALFKEPLPHIHTIHHGGFRFPHVFCGNGNIIVEFFDHIYRNINHEQWLEWAERAYQGAPTAGDSNSLSIKTANEAYQKSCCDVLLRSREALYQMKKALEDRREKIFSPRIDPSIANILNL